MQAADSWKILLNPLGHGYLSAQLIQLKPETSMLNLLHFLLTQLKFSTDFTLLEPNIPSMKG